MTTLKEHGIGKISGNAATPDDMYPLLPGTNRVDVTYPAGTTATITPKSTKDPNNTASLAPVVLDGSEVSITNTYQFQFVGPGWLCFIVSGYSGATSIDVFITR